MLCPVYLRLRQHYEAALRRWAQADSASNKRNSDASARLALEIEHKALNERNAAKERMSLHQQSCPTCNPGGRPRICP
jgi:hypothetical protein